KSETAASMALTHRWAARSLAAREAMNATKTGALFGIVQGGMHEDLRAESAAAISSLPFDGVACGGLSVGEPKDVMRRMVEATAPHLPERKPRSLMGVGRPEDR